MTQPEKTPTELAAERIRTALLAQYGDPELFEGATAEDVEQAKATHGRWVANADEDQRIARAEQKAKEQP